MENEYLQRILKLPKDILEDWQWNAGDHLVVLPDLKEKIVMSTALLMQSDDYIPVIDPQAPRISYELVKKVNARPVLTQDQIQNILMKTREWTPSQLVRESYELLETAYEINPDLQIESLATFWLDFLMGDYGLYWDAETQEWC
jgi:hypothetical protein